ncbi:hypothetical protein CDL15_Pgr019511 [Punica granatum]|uniref:Uncharacterized protein n=1 Tax=Punica granatum TaxID=22663 RepID=A0A218VU70_PUNGR|nr:hypothetical protein CDL15_Pgr019511 [Punica granatum]
MSGAKGSKILATTRYTRVADTMTRKFHKLSGLPDDDSLCLLMRMAKKEEHEWKNQNLEKIAREIVKKCAGVPLAIKTIGRLLAFSGTTEEDWLNFKDSDLSSINQEESDIMPSLKLSYDFLPSHLKLCFAYCSLFPQDYELESRELVYLWMAQGFINKPLGSKKTLEEVGYDYFRELLSRCFFQEIRENVYGDIMSCKMHDLALLVAGENCITIDSSHAKMFPEGARHITINDPNVLNGLERERRIRSLFLTAEESTDTFSEDSTDIFGNRIPIDVLDVSCFRSLRALRIRGVRIKMISRSIGELKHLRSLDLSITGELRSLPDSISELCNLESLNLTRCWHLEGLPSGITKLVNLRQLNVSGCDNLTHMPRGIGTLTNLQRLDVFVLGEESNQNAAGLDELSGLIGLKKELTIRRLERVGSSSISSEVDASFSMEKLAHLQCLDLCWGWDANASNDKEVIEKLRPHSDVKGLRIDRYVGVRLPSWVSQLHRLVEIEIKQCGCRQLPPIDQLPSLKRIWLHGLMNLEHIELSEGGTMPQSNFFPSLEEIYLYDLPKFKGWEWERRGNRIEEEGGDSSSSSSYLLMLPCSGKVKVGIIDCPRFSYMHGQQLLRLAGWRMRNVTALLLHQHDPLLLPLGPQHDSLSLTALTSLSISKIDDAEHFPVELFQSLPSLNSLQISDWPRLKAFPLRAIQSLPSLQSLEISSCPRFKALPPGTIPLPFLKRISLCNLTNLEHIELSEGGRMPQSNFFPSLEEIVLGYLPKFKGWEWERRGNRIEEEDGNSSSSSSLLMLPCFSDKVKIVIYTCGRFSYISHGEQLLQLAGWRMRNVTALLLHQHDPLLLPLGPQHDSLSLTALTSLSISKIDDAEHFPVELFQSLPSLNSLQISDWPRLKAFPLRAIQSLPSLQSLEISSCPRFKALPPGTIPLPFLKRISLCNLTNLEHIELSEGGRMPQSNFFPSLEEIVLGYLPKFKGWEWERRGNRIEEEDGNSSSSSSLLMLPCFSDKVKIVIYTCGRFSYISHGEQLLQLAGWRMRNVTALLLHQHDPLLLPLGPQHDSVSLTALTSLSIREIEDAEHFPVELFQSLPSLRELYIDDCPRLKALPLGAIFRYLSTLEMLEISGCKELDLSTENDDDDDDGNAEGESEEDMPMPLNLQFTKLRKLRLEYIPKLETLPWWIQHLTNLENLHIESCENLKALPEWFPNLTSLKHLKIGFCGEELTRRCQENTGEDWPKISHIQDVDVRR